MAYTFADLFEHSVDVMPDRLALIVSGEEVTYRELDERANRLAHYFQSVGLGVGSHIGIQLHNSIEAMVAVLAAFKIRGVPITGELPLHERRIGLSVRERGSHGVGFPSWFR